MIELQEILRLVESHVATTGETITQLSRRTTGSADTIRNWKRGAKEGKEVSAKFDNVQAVLESMGAKLKLISSHSSGQTPEADLRDALIAYGVGQQDISSVLKAINGFVEDADAQSRQGHPHDQSEPANRRRVTAP